MSRIIDYGLLLILWLIRWAVRLVLSAAIAFGGWIMGGAVFFFSLWWPTVFGLEGIPHLALALVTGFPLMAWVMTAELEFLFQHIVRIQAAIVWAIDWYS